MHFRRLRRINDSCQGSFSSTRKKLWCVAQLTLDACFGVPHIGHVALQQAHRTTGRDLTHREDMT